MKRLEYFGHVTRGATITKYIGRQDKRQKAGKNILVKDLKRLWLDTT